MTNAKRWSIIGMVALYAMLLAILVGVWLPHPQEPEPTPMPTAEAQAASDVWVYGLCRQDGNGAILRGAVVTVWQGGTQRGRSVATSGSWGMFVNPSLGLCTLRVEEPLGWFVVGMVPPVVTGWRYDGGASAVFDPPPSSPASDLVIYFAPIVTPTVPKTSTPVPTLSTPTPKPTPDLVPSPTWTPGPTPTLCYREPSAAVIAQAQAILGEYVAAGDDTLTRMGFRLGLGWPMLRRSIEVDGQTVDGQLWTPFTIVIQWPDGCYSVIDGGDIAP